MATRVEKDTMGEIAVPENAYWGAQTQRSMQNFAVGKERMPQEVIRAFVLLKKSVALVNHELKKLESEKCRAIVAACQALLDGQHDDQFPLVVWQTGSGTQSNMNVNEVIANLATELLGGNFRTQKLIHPNDHVNMSQSSNDTFPTAMHIAAVLEVEQRLLPALDHLRVIFQQKSDAFDSIVKIGRTHLQDATPITLGQEMSGYVSMLEHSREHIIDALRYLRELAIGGTAVGTGLNAHPRLGELVSQKLTELTGVQFISAPNKFHSLTSHDALTFASGANKGLAANLMKIANDVRWLASGPRCGLGEITIPENEPGSSIMPGKVNPTQSEMVTMVACQVFANDTAIAFGASQGNFELNVFKPLIIYNFLQSVRLLSDAMVSFADHCVVGLEPDRDRIEHHLHNSLMLVTALNPHIGYDKAALIAKTAHKEQLTLKEAALQLGLLTSDEFDAYVIPGKMVRPEADS
ncbi:class II fumarate hydratase [Chrysiogenes arsenatis]|uniref:class II fumarate hydratase n=1 Tax=Chrysiogenes arsenatis TaxID=309797 RepID=UPI00040C6F29|nr:class II fumarate hydratase [Chrysiogenes arsenatis]